MMPSLKKKLTREAREEVEAAKEKWRQEVEREKKERMREFRHRTSKYIVTIAGRVLSDVGDVDLEEKIVDVFIKRLEGQERDKLENLRESIEEKETPVTVESRNELSGENRKRITESLCRVVDSDIEPRFKEKSGMMPGIRVVLGGYGIAWSIEDYLRELDSLWAKSFDIEPERR